MNKVTKRDKTEVEHHFTAEEYKAKTEILAQRINDISLREEAVKAAAATAKAEIKAIKSEVSELANQLRVGHEQRVVEAIVEMDRRSGTKTYRHADGPAKGKIIKKLAMTEDDFSQLPLEDNPPPAAAEAPPEKGG